MFGEYAVYCDAKVVALIYTTSVSSNCLTLAAFACLLRHTKRRPTPAPNHIWSSIRYLMTGKQLTAHPHCRANLQHYQTETPAREKPASADGND